MKMDIEDKKCTTPEFRVSFPHVYEPKAFKGGEPKFSCAMLFPKNADLSELKRAAINAAKEKWGEKDKWPKNLDMGFRNGNEKEDMDGYKDTIYINAKSKQRPGIVDGTKKNAKITQESGGFYAGCYARATLIAYAYDTGSQRGVNFSLQNIQKLRDGEQFSGKKKAEDEFDYVEDGSDNENNYAKDDDIDLGF